MTMSPLYIFFFFLLLLLNCGAHTYAMDNIITTATSCLSVPHFAKKKGHLSEDKWLLFVHKNVRIRPHWTCIEMKQWSRMFWDMVYSRVTYDRCRQWTENRSSKPASIPSTRPIATAHVRPEITIEQLRLHHRRQAHFLKKSLTKLQLNWQKRKETQRCDKSHICPDHPRCATATKVVMWGGVPHIVNHARVWSKWSVQGFWLPGGSKSAIYLCLALWLI